MWELSLAKASGFGAIGVALLYAAVQLSLCGNAYAMRTDKIPEEQIEKYAAIARDYVEQSRGWATGDYTLSFRFVDDRLELALFTAVNLKSDTQLQEVLRAEGNVRMAVDPTEFTILVHTATLKAYEESPETDHPWRDVLLPSKP